MADLYVLAEHREGVLRDTTWELLGLARRLAAASSPPARAVAILLGHQTAALAAELARGAHEVLHVESSLLAEFNAEAYQSVLAGILAERTPGLLLIGHTACGIDLAPALSVQVGLPLASDCLDVSAREGRWHCLRQLYSGKIQADVVLVGSDRGLVTLRPGASAPAPLDLAGTVTPVSCPLEGEIDYRRFLGYVVAAGGDVDISQASIVVAVGRGIKEEANLGIIHDLAEALGGVVAGSRPVVDAGWLPKDRQVGSSGKTVKPKLYLAIGISGSFQHWVGMKGSETIVAINKDPNAPIFALADYGIVGDLMNVVPSLTARVKELRA